MNTPHESMDNKHLLLGIIECIKENMREDYTFIKDDKVIQRYAIDAEDVIERLLTLTKDI